MQVQVAYYRLWLGLQSVALLKLTYVVLGACVERGNDSDWLNLQVFTVHVTAATKGP
jgi:hypothetical protein